MLDTSNTPSGSSVHPYMSLAKSLNDSGYSIAGTVSELAQMYDTSRNYILNTFLSAASAAADRCKSLFPSPMINIRHRLSRLTRTSLPLYALR
jgi:hypothetical protein